MQISAKTRLVCLIVALVFEVCAFVGTGTYLIINHINNAKALDSETSYNIGNMISNTNNSLIDYDTYSALITKLNNDTTSTRNKSQINGGIPIVFQMGEINGNPIYWEVVYQTGNTITVWMTQPYTAEYFNNNGNTQIDGVFSGEVQTSYTYANYSGSFGKRCFRYAF